MNEYCRHSILFIFPPYYFGVITDGFTSVLACVRYVILPSFSHAFSSLSDLAVGRKKYQIYLSQCKWRLYVSQFKFYVKWIKQDNKRSCKWNKSNSILISSS